MISYDKDFYSWTQEQAELLRNGQFSELDIDNLIEEVESMGRSEKRELRKPVNYLAVTSFKMEVSGSKTREKLAIIYRRTKNTV